jgi:CRISPR-associated protein Cas1
MPQKSRNGPVWVGRCRGAIDNASLVPAFDEAGGTLEPPWQRRNALLLGAGSTVIHDAVRDGAAPGTCLACVGTEGTRLDTAPALFEHDADLARR